MKTDDFPSEFNGLTDPTQLLQLWIKAAEDSGLRDANAFILSTSDADNQPSSRVLLCKEIQANSLFFYTNYDSHKGLEMDLNNKVSMNFFWHEMHRQVRIQGTVKKTNQEKSLAYWKTRARGSQLSQLASLQSKPVESRQQMDQRLQELENQFHDQEIPLPTNWGGYELTIHSIEFWVGRNHRFHDRICFTKVENHWKTHRLYP